LLFLDCVAVDILRPLADVTAAIGVELKLHIKPKADDGSAQVIQRVSCLLAMQAAM
jgi:hypothetical protein